MVYIEGQLGYGPQNRAEIKYYACQFHAYLHSVEGDLDNSGYWYSRADMEPATASLETELNDIIKSAFIKS